MPKWIYGIGVSALFALCAVFYFQDSGATRTSNGPVATTEGFVDVNGVPLFYHTEGSGRPAIVINGGPGLDYSYLYPQLKGLHSMAKVVFYDQRASGHSGGEAHAEDISVKRFVADLEALRSQLGLERVDLVSHSWGAVLALSYALEYPEHVKTLVLLNPAPIYGREEAHQEGIRRMEQRRSYHDRAALSSLYVSPEFGQRDPVAVAQFFRLWFKGYFANPNNVSQLNLTLTDQTAQNALEINDLMNRDTATLDLIDRVAAIKVPTLIIGGGQDIFPTKYTRNLAETLGNARYIELDGSGHFSYIEDQQRVMDEIQQFWDAS